LSPLREMHGGRRGAAEVSGWCPPLSARHPRDGGTRPKARRRQPWARRAAAQGSGSPAGRRRAAQRRRERMRSGASSLEGDAEVTLKRCFDDTRVGVAAVGCGASGPWCRRMVLGRRGPRRARRRRVRAEAGSQQRRAGGLRGGEWLTSLSHAAVSPSTGYALLLAFIYFSHSGVQFCRAQALICRLYVLQRSSSPNQGTHMVSIN